MTLRGVARIVFGIVRDWARGVAMCTVAAVDQARSDVHTLTHLHEAIRDGCIPPDDLLAHDTWVTVAGWIESTFQCPSCRRVFRGGGYWPIGCPLCGNDMRIYSDFTGSHP